MKQLNLPLWEGEDADFRRAAKMIWHDEGAVEIDDEAVVSRREDSGAYVQAWVWVPYAAIEELKGTS